MTLGKLYKFTNCKILRSHSIYTDDLWVRNGKIVDPESIFFHEKLMYDEVVDMKGALIAPGFIDIQINGGYGVDFAHDFDCIVEGLEKVSKGILSHGVTAFCPTVVTSKPEIYKKVLPKIKKRKGGLHGAEILGVHVEGPFICLEKKGAHSAENILDFEKGVNSVNDVYGPLDDIKILTLAPEKKHALSVIKYLIKKDICVSLGHSLANFTQGKAAVKEGASLITHLFNAMLPFHHRDPGLVGLLSSDENISIYYGIIADGVHTHPSALRIAYKTHPKGAVLVTDAISAMGLLDGTHHIGEKTIEVRGNHAYIANTETLCGSVATMNKCVQFFKEATGCSTVEALEAASLHPAKALGLTNKGSLDFGADADFVALDCGLNVLSTWISGECVNECRYPPN